MEALTQPTVQERLATITVPAVRREFPAHQALRDLQLVYDPTGVAHLRHLGGPWRQTLCGAKGPDGEGWHYTSVSGAKAAHLASCEVCFTEGQQRRDWAKAERERLRETLAHANAIKSVLDELMEAGR